MIILCISKLHQAQFIQLIFLVTLGHIFARIASIESFRLALVFSISLYLLFALPQFHSKVGSGTAILSQIVISEHQNFFSPIP